MGGNLSAAVWFQSEEEVDKGAYRQLESSRMAGMQLKLDEPF